MDDNRRAILDVPLTDIGEPYPLREGVDPGYVARLGEAIEDWPPLTLRAGDLKIIDGHLRVLAARQLPAAARPATLRAVVLDIDDADAALERVVRNSCHGLPLTRAERLQAASRLIVNTDFSDRLIARQCGLSHQTVGRVRRRIVEAAGGPSDQPEKRRGRDGKLYTAGATGAGATGSKSFRDDVLELSNGLMRIFTLLRVWLKRILGRSSAR